MSILGTTKVCALIGDPVEHSLSPLLHNAAFQHLNLNYVYVAFQVRREELEVAIQGVRSLKIHALNVTMPLKVDVISYLDQLDESAENVGAVNTILNNKGFLLGYNTDGKGALMALKINNESPVNKKIVILGAGGASRAISYSLAREAREIVILNRTLEKAENLVKDLSNTFGTKIKSEKLSKRLIGKELKDADILINTTSLGMRPNENSTPVSRDMLRSDLPVFDLVYNPPETRLLREAKSVGAKTIEGLTMLVYQAAISFEIWTQKKAPINVMLKTSREKMGGTKTNEQI